MFIRLISESGAELVPAQQCPYSPKANDEITVGNSLDAPRERYVVLDKPARFHRFDAQWVAVYVARKV